jgi:REP element-mobilizing transposase RayT
MPRHARLDAPGTLHHVIVRGMEQGKIAYDRADRAEFVRRLGEIATATEMVVYAWALLPNHAHLLIRSGPQGLPRFMRRLLTGYAVYFNRRHKRHGHVFQNRYKSIVVEEDAYFQQLVRYIHLNPLRARCVQSLPELDRYPWCGHATLVGRVRYPWMDRKYVLAWFGQGEAQAVRAYRAYVREGISLGRRPELVGGGLVRSLGGWAEVRAVRRRQEPVLADVRILGTGQFVEHMLRTGEERLQIARVRGERLQAAARLIRQACEQANLSLEELRLGSRRRAVRVVRSRLATQLVRELGLSLADAARQLGVSTSGISKALLRAGK